MNHSQDDCARLERLLARMDDAAGAPAHRADPTDALIPDELAWAAAHVDGCPHCASLAASAATLVGGALRALDDAIPGDDFFAARRASILAAIVASDAPAHASPRSAPYLVAARPADRVADPGRRRSAAPPPRLRLRRRRVVPAAVAALLVIGLATVLLRPAREVPLEGDAPATSAEVLAVVTDADVSTTDEGDDAWLVASNDLFVAALAAPGDADPLASLSDEELEEIEDVFLATAGWS